MVNVLVSVAILLQLLVIVFALPTCPQLFKSVTFISATETMAKVELSPISSDLDGFRLKIHIAVITATYTENIGRVELEKSKEDTINELKSGNHIVYNVYVPTTQYISHVSSVTLNNRKYCTGNSMDSFAHVTLIELEHDLFARYSGDVWNGMRKKEWLENSSNRVKARNPYLRLAGIGIGLGFKGPMRQRKPVALPVRFPISSNDTEVITKVTTEAVTEATTKFTTRVVTQATTKPTIKPTIKPTTIDTTIECGRRANINMDIVVPLISIGEETSPGDWPWLAAIFVVTVKYDFQCAGSLVTNRHVITAAHCMRSRNSHINLPAGVLEVALGRYQLHNWREEGSANRHVLSYSIHPDYAFKITSDSDIAILVLWTPVEFSATIRPICLWSGSIDLQYVIGSTGYVVGWGKDEHGNPYVEMPRKANMPIVSQTECLFSNEGFIKFTSNRTFCAGALDGSGPCNGDSGSGLMLQDATRSYYVLRGIVSQSLYGTTIGCDLFNYVVFVDVANYIDWINNEISAT